MLEYFGSFSSSALSVICIVFAIASFGYLLGAIKVKGIELGTAGVLIIALAFGVLASYVPTFEIGSTTVTLFDEGMKAKFGLVSSIGTAMFVTAVGLIAGPKFFRTFNKKSISYIVLGVIIISIGALTAIGFVLLDNNLSPEMAVGLLTGALTSTPGLSAAKEVATDADAVTAGYGIAYLFGVIGVVLFVQLIPKLLRVNMEQERDQFVAANAIAQEGPKKRLYELEPFGFLPFAISICLGCLIGAIKIPGINFSLGTSGGTLVSGLLIGHFGRIGRIDLRVKKETLNFLRELGLMFFLIGAGVPGGVNFVSNVRVSYFIYGAIMTLVPMIVGFLIAKYVFKLSLFNNLGSITGGMTSTPALGTLISTAGTDEVAGAYAATYPIALVCVVLAAKIIVMVD